MTYDGVIGKDGRLPWYIPEDLKKFRELTAGNTIVMGRRTFESIGKPLPKRDNIVVSTSLEKQEGITVCKNLESAILEANKNKNKTFIIGGASIYEQTLPFVERMYISYVSGNYEGDKKFPEYNKQDWFIVDIEYNKEFIWTHLRRKLK